MGRWRPPPPKSSPYITAAGFDALQADLKAQWTKRRDVVKALAAAAAEGDRSENAEYIYRKKELAGIDRRIRYLQKRLPSLTVVREFANRDAVYFGAEVDLLDGEGRQLQYRVVGADEADDGRHAISMDSPLARALLGKRVGEEVSLDTPERSVTYTVERIRYP